MNLLFYFFIILSILSEVYAQYLFKIAHNNKKYKFVPLGIILYAFTGFFAFKLLKYTHLVIANIIWHILHFILLFFVGFYFLNEKLTQQQIIATIFGIISLFLFMIDGNHHHH